MTALIPYFQRQHFDTLMLSDINNGGTLCKRMGLQPIGIIVGKREKEEIRHFCSSGGYVGIRGTRKFLRQMGASLIFSKAESELTFVCERIE